MPTLQELESAFIKADDAALAGDKLAAEDARAFANEIKRLRSGQPESKQEPTQQNWFEQNMPATATVGRSLYGVPEAIASVGSGMAASAYGGWKGLASIASGEGIDEATRTMQETQQEYTYHPKTVTGKSLTRLAGLPIELGSKATGYAGGKIGELFNGEQGRIAGESIGEASVPIAATLFGGAAALRSARAAGAASDAIKLKELQQQSIIDASKIDAANAAKRYGLKLNPTEVNPTKGNKIVTGIANQNELNTKLSLANENRLPMIMKKDLNIDSGSELTIDAIKAGRAEKGQVYEAIKKIGTIPEQYSEILAKKISGMGEYEGMTQAGIDLMKRDIPKILDEVMLKSKEGFNGADVVNLSKKYRKEANSLYKKQSTVGMSPEESALADANISIANGLEDMISARLTDLAKENPKSAYGGLSKKWTDARKYIATSHAWENATDLNTGKINPSILAEITKKDNALTGTLADIGKIAGNFPNVMQYSAKKQVPKFVGEETLRRYGAGGVVGGTIGLMAGGPGGIPYGMLAGAATERGIQPFAQKYIISDRYQSGIKPLDYRPVNPILVPEIDNSLHPGTIIPKEETGLTLAPKGSRISPINLEQSTPYQSRGLLSLQDELTPTRSSQPQPFAQGMDFTLRQEFLNRPEIVKTINAFRQEQSRLEDLVQNASGFWKHRYQAELNKLRNDFAVGMKQIGISNAADAHGLNRKLYEPTTPSGMGIVKGGMFGDNQ